MVFSQRLCVITVAALAAACQSGGPTKDEIEAAKSTLDCDNAGDRLLIRFTEGEARILMTDGTRAILYQVPVANGIRYTNGDLDLRGRGLNFEFSQGRQTVQMVCKQYEIPAKKE